MDGAANDATINEAAKFAVEAVRIFLCFFSFSFFHWSASSTTGFCSSFSFSHLLFFFLTHTQQPPSSSLLLLRDRPPSPATGPRSSSSASSRPSSRSSRG